MQWQDFLTALGLLLVIEGLLPFLNPGLLKRVFTSIVRSTDERLRVIGLISMLSGVFLLIFVR